VWLVFLGFAGESRGQISWNNAGGGNWDSTTDWLPEQIPGPTNTAVVSLAGNYQITLNVAASVESLTFSASSGSQTFSIPSATLTLASNSSFNSFCQLALGTGTIMVNGGTTTLGGDGTSSNGTLTVAKGATVNLTGGNSVTWSGQLNGNGSGEVLFSGGTINPSPILTLAFTNGLFQWGGGIISGGTITNNGTVTIEGPALSTLIGSATFVNQGLVDASGAGGLAFDENFSSDNTFDNLAIGTFEFSTDAVVFADGCCSGPGQVFDNEGLVWKSGGTNTSAISVVFNNDGGVARVDTGTLTFDGGGTSSNGTFTVAAGATLDLTGSSTATWAGQMSGSGAGTVLFDNGTILPRPGLTLAFPNGLFQWATGTFSGGTVTNNGTVTLEGPSGGTLLGSVVFDNQGLVEATGSGGLAFDENFSSENTFDNLAKGVFEFTTDTVVFTDGCCGTPGQIFNNVGLMWKSGGSGASVISVVFNNLGGGVEVDQGQLVLSGGGSSSNGTFTVASGATLDLTGGGGPAWAGEMSGSGEGEVLLGSGSISPNPGLTLAFTNGLFQWGGGSFTGGTVTNTGIVVMEGATAGTLALGATIVNQGLVEATGLGGMEFNENYSSANTFSNLTKGVFEFATDSSINADGCCDLQAQNFNNQGLVWKSGGSNTSSISIPFNNLGGTVEVDQAELVLNGGGSSSNGTFTVAAGATLDLTGISTMTWAGLMNGSGAGQVLFASGTILPQPGLTLDFTNGLFQWGSGIFSAGTVTNNGVVVMEGATGGTLALSATFINQGLVEAVGLGGLDFNENYSAANTFDNLAKGVFEFATDSGMIADGCCGLQSQNFNNQGLVWKSGGSNASVISIPFNNLGGALEVDQGQLVLSGGGSSSTGTFTVASGATLDLTGGNTVNWAGTMSGSGAGQVLLGSGTITPNGLTLAFTNGLFQWGGGFFSAGTVTNSGVVVMEGATAGTLELSATFVNQGLVQATGAGGLVFNENYSANNTFSNLAKGVFEFTADDSIFTDGCCGLAGQIFYNQGLVRKSGGTNTSAISVVFNNQGGSLEVDSGTIALGNNNYVQGGGDLTFTLGGQEAGQSGQLTLGGTATLNGPLTVKLAEGYVPPAGTQFQILSANSVTGTFSALNVPSGFVIAYSSTGVTLTFTDFATYGITAVVTPAGAGSVSGTGLFLAGVTNTLVATANYGYAFSDWTENGVVVGTSPDLTLVVTNAISLTATFVPTNITHVVTVASSPGGAVAITGAGSYSNGQTAVITAPATFTKTPNFYTFQYFTLNGTFVSSNTSLSVTFSTLDSDNYNYVAVYSAESILPLLVNVSDNYPNPVPETTNFVLRLQFNRTMQTADTPVFFLTNTTPGASLPTIGANGRWSATVYSNDTYSTPPITFGPGMDGTLQVFVSKAQDLGGNVLAYTNAINLTVESTPPMATITSPTNGYSFTTTNTVTFSADALSVYGITNLALYAGSNQIATTTTTNISASLGPLAKGSYSLTAVAADAHGLSATSAVVHVTVNVPGTMTIDFEAVDATSGPVEGTALANYLAGYGVTLTDMTTNTTVAVQDDQNILGGAVTVASSGNNLLTQIGTNGAVAYTLTFNRPYPSVSWTRTELLAGTAGVLSPVWRAYAYDSNGVELASVGETQMASETNLPAAQFTLSGTNITSITFQGNNSVGVLNNLPLDDLTLSTVAPGANIEISLSTGTNSVLTAPGMIVLNAQASELNGAISRIDFYEGNNLVGTTIASSAGSLNGSVTLANLAAGTNTFTAVATDASGATRSSAPLTVIIAPAAGINVINFDSLDASSGAVAGPLLSNYMAGFGVTLVNNTFGTRLEVVNAGDLSGAGMAVPSSPPNFLTQVGLNSPVEFTMVFAPPAQSVGFTRIGLVPGSAGVSHPAWSARAFNAAGAQLEAVGEPLIFSLQNVPARTFRLVGNNISRVQFDSDSQGTASFSSVLLDDVVLNANTVTNPLSILLNVVTAGPFTAPATISLTALVNDSIGTVASVDFYAGANLIGMASGGPYGFVWTNVLAGTNTLTAQLNDSSGYSISSAAVQVVVNRGTGVAASTLVNFDSLNAAQTNVAGTALAAYLKANGMTATNLSAGTELAVENQALVAGGGFVAASSPPNVLTQIGSDKPVSFTLEFSPLLKQFSFTRPELLANPFVSHPAWQAQAYDSLGVLLAVAQEGLISSYTNVPAQTFALNGPAGIATIQISSQSSSLNTFGALVMDDFILTPSSTPVPPAIVLTNPLPGQIYTAPALILLAAETFDSGGTVTGVSYYSSGVLIGKASSSPFSIIWSNSTPGDYSLTAVASDSLGLVRTSAPVSITFNPEAYQLGILSQPVGSIQPVGGSTLLSVTATGTNAMTFQWNFNGVALPGQTQPVLSLSQLEPNNSGSYTVVIQSEGQSITSAPAVVNVLYPPSITQPPQSQQVLIGAGVTLTVGATGAAPLSYQWLQNGAGIAGATNSSYTISAAAQPFNSGEFQVTVANAVGFTNSPVAAVNVTVAGSQSLSADDFANRISIDPRITVFGSNVGATSEPGEPNPDGKPGGKSIWYTWQASFTGVISLTTLGSSFDTLLAVYTGTNVAELTTVAADDDSGGYFTSLVTFNCEKGTNYQIDVDGFQGASGSVVLGLPPGTGYRVLNPTSGSSIPVITQPPTNQVVSSGSNMTLSVTATSPSPLTYQWFFQSAPITGATNSLLVITNFQANSVGNYYVLAANNVGAAQSEPVSVQIANQGGPGVQIKFGDAVDLAAGGNMPEVARPLDEGGDTRGFSVARTFTTVGGTREPGEPDPCGQAGGSSVWYIYRTPVAGTFHVDTIGSTFSTILAVFTSTVTAEPTFSTLVDQGCGFVTNYFEQGQPAINLPNIAENTELFIMVDGYGGAAGTAQLNIGVGQPPTIVTQPQSRPAVVGGNAAFSVSASGTTNFFYQWLFDSAPMAGATTSTFTLTNAKDTSAGTYSVVVSNIIDVVTSQPAALTLQAAPFILTQPSNQLVGSGQKAGFSVTAEGVAPLSYQWFDNGAPIARATSSNLVFASTSVGNHGSYSLVVSNAFGSVTSAVAILTVGETTKPTVAIVSPANAFTTFSPSLTLTGTASDTVAVTSVQVLINGNAVAVTGSNHWSAAVSLKPGTNVITAQSFNASGLASALVTHSVFYTVTSKLTLLTAGTGTGKITGQTNQAVLIINKLYTLHAAPSANCFFSNWVGGTLPGALTVQGTNAALSFLMASNLILQANFVTNPFPAVAGSYNGLFYPTNGVTEQASGLIAASVEGSSGGYTANIRLDGGSYSFSGAFSLAGEAQATIKRTGQLPVGVLLHLNLNMSPADDQMLGTVSSGNWTSSLEAERAILNSAPALAGNFAGRYTMVIPPGSGAPERAPGGYGFATITNTPAGNSAISGHLGDSAQFSQSVAVSKEGNVPVYASLYSGQGLLLGWITFGNTPQTPSGTLSWIKTGGPAHTLYSGGFTNLTNAVAGSVYVPPPASEVLQLTNGTLTIDDPGQGIQLVYTNVSVVSDVLSYPPEGNPSNALAAAFTNSTGAMTVSFHPTGAKTSITALGVVLQNHTSNAAAGWFVGTNQTGSFLLRP
jgi:hypothetical protein